MYETGDSESGLSETARLDDLTRFAASLCNAAAVLLCSGSTAISAFGMDAADVEAMLPLCVRAKGAGDTEIASNAPEHRLRLLSAASFASGSLCVFGEGGRSGLTAAEEDSLRFLARQAEWLIADRARWRGEDPIAQELSHRIRNIFSVIAGLIGLSGSRYPELAGLVADLRQRVLALGRAQDFVGPEGLRTTGRIRLCGLLRQLFEPYGNPAGTSVAISGEDPEIDDRSATPLALIFHELATNAIKHGALSHAGGGVTLSISSDGGDWRLCWDEWGGKGISEPVGTGFGSQLITLSLERQLGGRINRQWRSEGLWAEIRIPADVMTRSRKQE